MWVPHKLTKRNVFSFVILFEDVMKSNHFEEIKMYENGRGQVCLTALIIAKHRKVMLSV